MFENYDDVVTLCELMEMLDIGKSQAYLLLRSGQIKSFRVGGKGYRIPKICIEEYVLSKVQMQIEQYKQLN